MRATRQLTIVLIFLGLGLVYTWPLARELTTGIASDPFDPILNTTVLWWNAVHVPFTAPWWDAPQFFPSTGVAAFTENLTGISLIASPVFWITGNPLAAYNLALLLTWPLSAMSVYLLVRRLTRRDDAAFIAGLAYGFTPYRTDGLAHVQTLSSYWLPIALLALHAYIDERRRRWLWLFAAAWLLQSLANGYYLFFGGVLIGLWIAWFGSRRAVWPATLAVVATWVAASLPLLPVLLRYRSIHDHYAMHRDRYEAIAFSATPQAFAQSTPFAALWHHWLPVGAQNLFPGVTALAVLVLSTLAVWRWRERDVPAPLQRWLRLSSGLAFGASVLAIAVMLVAGPIDTVWHGVLIRMRGLDRALIVLGVSGIALIGMTPALRADVARRRPLLFYAASVVVMAVLSCGPIIVVHDKGILAPAPYEWFLLLPGFNELRVPARFWMLGELSLCVAAGIALARVFEVHAGGRRGALSKSPVRLAMVVLIALGIWLDGRMSAMPVAVPPQALPEVELADSTTPVLELPLGPAYDAAATYRARFHGRRVINGVSGYDPPHYGPLQDGLRARDPGMLPALSSISGFDVIVNRESDGDRAIARYAAAAPGAVLIADDGQHVAYRVPKSDAGEPALGQAWPIAAVDAFRHDTAVTRDGRFDTEWGDMPQRPGQWIRVDLGEPRLVAGVTHGLGRYANDYPRQLMIEASIDGTTWNPAWEGPTAAAAFLAAVRGPREAAMRIAFPAVTARYLRLRQLATDEHMWRLAEMAVHAPVASPITPP